MRRQKSIISLALTLSLAFSSISYAVVTVPPVSTVQSTENTDESSAGPTAAAQTETPETAASSQASGGASRTVSAEIPVIQSEGAVLLDAGTGEVLFGKNENKQFYPASITKVMTGLLVVENCSLSDTVTFSAAATTNLESGAVSLGVSEGDKLTVEQSMYGLLLKSANEIGNGLAEHISGSVSAFADKMNARAKELGCLNTHFTNPHGLNDSNHYTTPYDMALIARAAFQNEAFRKIDTTLSYNFPALKNASAKTITMGHKMMYTTDSRYYPGIIGGKTGYTSLAGNTLVTGAERDGVRLVAVVMKSRSTHYTDTKALLDYGFARRGASSGQSSGSSQSQGTGSGAISPVSPVAETSASETTAAVQTERSPAGDWKEEASGWTYVKSDGTAAAGEWIQDEGDYYWIDTNGYMARGWRQFSDGTWYYFRSGGKMAKNYWAPSGNSWFYLGSDGKMMTNTTTPDGYRVDETGRWVQ